MPNPPKILLVDDKTAVREAIAHLLICENYEVVSAINGQDALAKAISHQPDAVLLDVDLPDSSGWHIFERLAAQSPNLPVILVTGRHEVHRQKADGKLAGFLEKPLDLQIILESLQRIFAIPSRTRQTD